MSKVTGTTKRPQSPGEELANSITHGVALLGSVAAIPVLVAGAARDGGVAGIVGAGVFGVSMFLLYLSSTIYHALPAGKAKQVFQIVDHCAIFLLIAGTYTPFTLGVLRGSWGWSLFGIVWGLAILGVLHKTIFGTRFKGMSTGLYLAMGWLIVVAAQPMLNSLPRAGVLWLVAGGLAYTVGVVFYIGSNRVRFAHSVWHLFVVAGTACHFAAVFWYAAKP